MSDPAVPRPVVLIIRDGWGSNPFPERNASNAVFLARKPVDDRLMREFPHVLIKTCGNDVGLPDGVVGNSEVGHQNIGAGRIVEQELMRITGRIRDGSFFTNPALVQAFERATQTGGAVHIMGLVSDGRVHSDLDHLYAILELSRRLKFPGDRVFVHAFTDGRDTKPTQGIEFIHQVEEKCREFGVNPVASVIGRWYSMDRDNRWERVEAAYRMLVQGQGKQFSSAAEAIRDYYDHPTDSNRVGDEFIVPSLVVPPGRDPAVIRDGGSVIFFNFRGDRPREITKAFVLDEFPFDGLHRDGIKARMGFERGRKLDLCFVAMTGYEEGLPVNVAFIKPPKMRDILGDYVSHHGLKQFRCSETEKYPHVTFFFNDYRDDPFPGEERKIVASPRDITTYDQKPEMSAYGVTEIMLERISSGTDDLIILNYANPDMVGHTGSLTAAVRAVEVTDECVGRVVNAILKRGGALVVTADHGNCEQMIDPATGGPDTAHTLFDVELIVVGEAYRGRQLRPGGRLADIAPTLLEMMGLPKPEAMTGTSLLI